MYKVLIVDDEPTIREGLRTLIDWAHYGYRVEDTAVNGIEALAKCQELKPDLMIIDIRMPRMTGLEVIEQLRTFNAAMRILILSGYADFEYAKRAITYRADGYLLKPVDEDELTEYLVKLRRIMDEQRVSNPGGIGNEWTKEKALVTLLTTDQTEADVEAAAEFIPSTWPAYEIVLIRPSALTEVDPASLTAVKRKLTERLEHTDQAMVFSLDLHIGLLIKNGVHINRSVLTKALDVVFDEESLDYTAVSGGVCDSPSDIRASYKQALELMKHRFFFPKGIIYDRESWLTGRKSQSPPSVLEVEAATYTEKLYLAVDAANAEVSSAIIQQYGQQLLATGADEAEIKAHYGQLMTGVINKFIQHYPGKQEKAQDYAMQLLDIHNEYRYEDYVRSVTNIMLRMIDTSSDLSADKQVKRMIDLIERNYQENLKLETMAEIFNYNSAYLGKLFKNVTGEYFNTYVDKVRMHHAKSLLEQGLKVYEVAELVGYANVDYFHSKFRKYVGMAPSAYRKNNV